MNRTVLVVWMSITACVGLAAQASPYSGEQERAIKALSVQEVSGYLAGEGLGFAKAAELNHYPGPKHVLAMAAELKLSAQQRSAAEEIFQRMRREAVSVGEELVEKERKLDELFSTAKASAETVSALTAEIGALGGRLRLAHLKAHLEMRAILSEEQVAAYDQLRGYGAGGHQHDPERHK